jgi:hypothetical protein
MLPRTSKDKSARVDWGYHARPSPTAATRRRLWAIAAVAVVVPLLAATAWAALAGGPPAPLAQAASRGELASPHAAFDANCEACHEPFRPTGGDGWFARLTGDATAGHASDAKCEACHAGAAHHPRVPDGAAGACADCHRDHRGRDASLVRLADADCTRCHANPTSGAAVAAFPNGHPEFRAVSPKTDAEKHRRTLKFSHAVHMAAGMNVGTGYRFADIPDAVDRTRYMALLGETDPNAPVKLNCAACHRLDPARPDGAAGKLSAAEEFSRDTRLTLVGLPKDAIQPARPAGAVFLPVVFETDCRACHPLTFDESAGLRDRHAPHRVQPADLDRFLHEVYAGRYVADQLKPPPEVDRGPGRLDPRPGDLDPDAKALARKKIG